MNDDRELEQNVASSFAAVAPSRAPDGLLDPVLTSVSRTRQRPRWLAILKEPPMRHASRVVVGSPTARVTALGAVTLLMALLASGALVAGAQSPSPPPPEDSAATQPPTEFTGVWCIGPEVAPDEPRTSTSVEVGGEGVILTQDRHGAWRNAVVMSDPRLQGDAYQTYEQDRYSSGRSLTASTSSIVNEDGAWVNAEYLTSGGTGPHVFIGEGAYEGLVAIMTNGAGVRRPEEVDASFGPSCNEIRGSIFDGAPVLVPYLAQ